VDSVEDRMTSATVASTTTTFAYLGNGLRNTRTSGGATTTFTWDIGAGLPLVLDDGNQYVYGAGLEAMVSSGTRYYYLADGLGSTMAMVDSTGAVQKSYTYDVYGKPTATGALANEFDFAGQQTDATTGLQYLRARYMDVNTGTFVSRDPMASDSGWLGHPFTYAASSPASFLDPTGLAETPGLGSEEHCMTGWCNVGFGPFLLAWNNTTYKVELEDGFWLEEYRTSGRAAGRWQVCGWESDAGSATRCNTFDPAVESRISAELRRLAAIAETTFAILAPIYGTNAAARAAAKINGWEETRPDWARKDSPTFRKGNRYFQRDRDGHNGGAWKEFDQRGNRVATLDKDLNVIKD
jgi:RHS repeat-associated protein